MANTKYTHAIVSRVPEIYAKEATVIQSCFDNVTFDGLTNSIFSCSFQKIDLLETRKQHACLVNAVRSLGLDVLELPPDESNAASVFTQDLAVVVNGIALMCRPSSYRDGKSASQVRQVEVDTMRAVLKKELNQTIVDPPWTNNALLSGSDVLFTGREFFVGLSDHTNMEGALAVASTWPEYPCTPIKVRYILDRNCAKNLIISSGTDEVRAKREPSLCNESLNGHFWSNLCLNCIFKWT